MFFRCQEWSHCRALDGLVITWALYPWWAQCFPYSRIFSVPYPGRVLTFFVIPWGSRIWFSSPVFLLYRFSGFGWFPVPTSFFYFIDIFSSGFFCKLRRLSGQPAEAKAQAYDARFEGLRDIRKVFEGLDQDTGRVRQGRVGRSRLSCRSYR